jgi:hypothetical protein
MRLRTHVNMHVRKHTWGGGAFCTKSYVKHQADTTHKQLIGNWMGYQFATLLSDTTI